MKPSNLPVNQLMGLIRMLPPEVKATLAQLLAQEQGQVAAPPGDEKDLDLWEDDEDWNDEEELEEDEGLKRRMLLAAEVFGYSYAHYEDRLGNPRFDQTMPREIDLLELAVREGWDDARLAAEMEREIAEMPSLREAYRRAVEIVDAPDPAESFRRGVRISIEDAMAEGLTGREAIAGLVVQICYRAADLGYLLDVTGEPLWVYSEALCHESDLAPDSPLPGEEAQA